MSIAGAVPAAFRSQFRRDDAKMAVDHKWPQAPAAANATMPVLAQGKPIQAALALDFATWVAIASISGGDRQS
jgi:hypothetical protein